MNGVGLGFFAGDDFGDEFQEIDAALLALAALPLFMLAGRALVAKRVVAARAESRNVASFRAAFRAFHGSILAGRRRPSKNRAQGVRAAQG